MAWDDFKDDDRVTPEWNDRRRPPSAPEQLPMFMTAREITSKYQPLDGDREDIYLEEDEHRAGHFTARPQGTDGAANTYIGNQSKAWGIKAGPGSNDYQRGLLPVTGRQYRRPSERAETDDEVWSRKYDEANMDPEEYAEHRGGYQGGRKFLRGDGGIGSTSYSARHISKQFDSQGNTDAYSTYSYHRREPVVNQSLRDEIVYGKGIPAPVHLMDEHGWSDKPQVAGGHHRIAVMLYDKPDDLMPVIHHHNWNSARSGRGYEYT